jgi:hypothetical protein
MSDKDQMRWTPAVVRALADGNIQNAIIAATPGGIEAQEAQGQRDFVSSETLPLKCDFCERKQLETMGIVYSEQVVDDLFVCVSLPNGWHKQPTTHSMWSELVDDQGRTRCSIFYKAAFYDRDAFITIKHRYSCSVSPISGYDNPDYYEDRWHCTVADWDGTILWTSEELEPMPPHPSRGDEDARQTFLDWYNRKGDLRKLGESWLGEHYPDWRDPLAYWEGSK